MKQLPQLSERPKVDASGRTSSSTSREGFQSSEDTEPSPTEVTTVGLRLLSVEFGEAESCSRAGDKSGLASGSFQSAMTMDSAANDEEVVPRGPC
jgi:hypothetical protein